MIQPATQPPRADSVMGRIVAARDPKRALGSGRQSIVWWGCINLAIAAIWTIAPFNFGGYFTGLTTLMYSNVALIFVACLFLRVPLRLNFTLTLIFVFTIWTQVSTILMGAETGRMIGISYPNLWVVHIVSMYLVMSIIVYIEPKVRRFAIWMLFIPYVLSGIVGLLQFVRFGPALNASFTGAFAQEWGGIRSNGLTGFPSFLGFQGLVGTAIIGSRLMHRRLTNLEILGFLFFSSVTMVAQYRTLFFGLGLVWVFSLICAWRREGPAALKYFGIIAGVVLVPVILFPDNFSYVLRSKGLDDPNLIFRQQKSWVQLDYIFETRPWTGIGADTALMMTTPNVLVGADKWSWYVMDNSYRLLVGCYGIIGLILGVGCLVAIYASLWRDRMLPYESPERKTLLSSVLLLFTAYMVVCFLTNFLIYPQIGYQMAILLGLTTRTWYEEATALPRESRIRNLLAAASARSARRRLA